MKDFSRLKKYLAAEKSGGWGWMAKYEDELMHGEINYASLVGHYSGLLSDALSLIPPAILEHVDEISVNRKANAALRTLTQAAKAMPESPHTPSQIALDDAIEAAEEVMKEVTNDMD